METRYPIRKADGKDFAGPDEVLALLRNEKHGQWLAGNNGMWHGGIHISRNAAPQAVISAESPEGAIPIQCIAQGEIVAWRIQQEYHQQPYGEAVEGEEPVMLQNSSAFVLVRSVHKPDDNPATWLTFYTLYMHLAPLSCFPKMKMFQVTQQGNGLSMRRYSGSEEPGQLAPDSSGRLRAGDKVMVTEEITFMLRSKKRDLAGRTPPDVPSPFGLAQKVKDGVPQGEKFWTSALPQYVAPLGDKYAYLPDWMAKAVESGSLDAVVIPPEPVAIRAGEAIGFLARDDAPGRGSAVLSDWFMHIEVLSNDANMPAFLNNPGHLTKGTMYLEVQGNQPLYYCEEKGDKKTFTVMDVTTSTDAGKLLRRDDASPFKDDAGITWYKLRPHTWMKQEAVKEIIQHDLKALRFTPLQQEPAKDFQQSLGEQWLGKAFSFIGGAIHPERALESQELSEYYSQIAKVLDANGDGKISSTELDLYRSAVLQGLRNRNEEVEMLLRRLIVKHESEWYGKSAHPRWQTLLASLPKDGQDYVKKWIDNHEWMSQVPALAKDEALWHFHPVEFLHTLRISNKQCYCYNQGIIDSPCQSGALDVTKDDFELLATQLGVEREVLRAIAVAETGDKVPFKQYVNGENHAAILYERHFMKRLSKKLGVHPDILKTVEATDPKLIHGWVKGYKYGSDAEQYERLTRARKINYDAANMSCSWGKFQVMGEYYHHLYKSTKELVEAQNYCAKQHLQYFKVFLVDEKKMLQCMKDKNWLTIAIKYNGAQQDGYDTKIEKAYNHLKNNW